MAAESVIQKIQHTVSFFIIAKKNRKLAVVSFENVKQK